MRKDESSFCSIPLVLSVAQTSTYHVRQIPLEVPCVPSRVVNFCCYRRSCRKICSSCRRGPARRRSSFKGSKEWRIKYMWVCAPLAPVLNSVSTGASTRYGAVKLRKDVALITSALRGIKYRRGFISDGRRDNSDKGYPDSLQSVNQTPKADRWDFFW